MTGIRSITRLSTARATDGNAPKAAMRPGRLPVAVIAAGMSKAIKDARSKYLTFRCAGVCGASVQTRGQAAPAAVRSGAAPTPEAALASGKMPAALETATQRRVASDDRGRQAIEG